MKGQECLAQYLKQIFSIWYLSLLACTGAKLLNQLIYKCLFCFFYLLCKIRHKNNSKLHSLIEISGAKYELQFLELTRIQLALFSKHDIYHLPRSNTFPSIQEIFGEHLGFFNRYSTSNLRIKQQIKKLGFSLFWGLHSKLVEE